MVSRFYLEVRAIARLMHPNIVTAFDAGCAHGVHYLVMELVDGVSLSQFVMVNGPLKLDQAVHFLIQACSALGYAHSQGVVHRDIKPGNMMWTKSGVLKILDFGLAQLAQEVTAETPSKKLVGTVEYMSPEQVNTPQLVDHRSDLYSLGATLFYLLTGRAMFVGEPLQIAMDQVRKVPPALYEVRADIDLRLDAIFQKLVAKDPIDRFQTAESVIAKLDTLHLSSKKSFAMPSLSDSPLRNAEPTTNRPFGESTSQRSYDAVGIELGQMTTRASLSGQQSPADRNPIGGRTAFYSKHLVERSREDCRGRSGLAAASDTTQSDLLWIPTMDWHTRTGAIVCRSTHSSRNLASHSSSKGLRCLPSSVATDFPCSRQRAGCYDQLHRHSILTACRAAGIEPLQLLDRPLAAALALMETQKQTERIIERTSKLVSDLSSILGLRSECGKDRRRGVKQSGYRRRLEDGVSKWYHRIAELLAKKFFDLSRDRRQTRSRRRFAIAAVGRNRDRSTQRGPASRVAYEAKQKEIRWTLGRLELLKLCEDLIAELIQYAKDAIDRSKQTSDQITHLLLVGELFAIPALRDLVRKLVDSKCVVEQISKGDLARGAALQARRWIPPVESSGIRAESRTRTIFGLVTVDAEGASSVLECSSNGAPNSPRMSRTLRPSSSSRLPQLQFVESTRLGATNWHRLGNVNPLSAFPRRPADDPLQLRLEIDSSGVLACKLSWLKGNMQYLVPPLDNPPLDLGTIQQWRNWIETLFLCQADSMDSKS